MCDYVANNCGDPALVANTAVWMSIGNNIVSMKAQYGRDDSTANPSPMNGIVNLFDKATPAAAAGCEWARIESVRLALVARNTQPNKSAVTLAAPVWFGSVGAAPAGILPGNVADPIDLTGTNASLLSGTSWANYRYKVFQTTIPLRNIVMKGVASGC
jgi:type IV pilus assembly protein PilW